MYLFIVRLANKLGYKLGFLNGAFCKGCRIGYHHATNRF